MKLASLENVKDLDSLDREIDVIVNSIEIESYAKPIRLLLKKTIQLAVGYIVYYIPRVEKEYEITWDNVGYTLRDFLDTEELRTGWCSNDISLVFKRQISRYSYLIGGELFEDFEDWDKPEDLAKRYDKDFGGLAQYAENDLQGLLPDIDNEIMTLYKIALYEVSQNLIGYDE